jgi:ribonuclease PH
MGWMEIVSAGAIGNTESPVGNTESQCTAAGMVGQCPRWVRLGHRGCIRCWSALASLSGHDRANLEARLLPIDGVIGRQLVDS